MTAVPIKTTVPVIPQCYAYTTPGVPAHDGWTKIGFTERDVETRIKEQTHTVGVSPKIWWHMLAAYITAPLGTFTDKAFHAYLKKLGVPRQEGTEWFQIDPIRLKTILKISLKTMGSSPMTQRMPLFPINCGMNRMMQSNRHLLISVPTKMANFYGMPNHGLARPSRPMTFANDWRRKIS